MKVVNIMTNDSNKTVHNLQLTSAWIRSLKTIAGHYNFLFSLFYTIKEIFLAFRHFFSIHIEPATLVMKFPTRVHAM